MVEATSPELITTDELAKRLHSSAKSLERWRLTGQGPRYTTAGRRVLYRWSDVEAWLEARARQSTSEAA